MDNFIKKIKKNTDNFKKRILNTTKEKDKVLTNIKNAQQIVKKNVANVIKDKDKIIKNVQNVSDKIKKSTSTAAKAIGIDKLFKTYSYPINNYEFNYKGLVDNKYKPEILGVNSRGTVRQFKHNLRQTDKYFDGLIFDGNPDKNAIAGISDVPIGNTDELIRKQQNASLGMPYNRFRIDYPESEYPTNGKFSSSYFVQSGFCPVESAKTKTECNILDPNYTWIPNPINIPDVSKLFYGEEKDKIHDKEGSGTCYKPRYSYLNNAAESDITSGMIPSMMDDVSDLNPIHLIGVSTGKPVLGSRDNQPPRFQLLPCVEGFHNYLNKNISSKEKILNQNILNNMEHFTSQLAGSLMIDRPNVNREYFLPNNTSNNNIQTSNYIQEDFEPSANDGTKHFTSVQYNNQIELPVSPLLINKIPNISSMRMDKKKVIKNGVKNSKKKDKIDTILSYNPITLFLFFIFFISLIYVGSY